MTATLSPAPSSSSTGPELILVNMNSLFSPTIIRKPNLLSRDGDILDIPVLDNEHYKVVYHGSSEGCRVLIVEAKRDRWDEAVFGPDRD